MIRVTRVLMAGLVVAVFCVSAKTTFAEKPNAEFRITTLPARYGEVFGNTPRFQSQHWMKSGFTGGIEEFTYEEERKDGWLVELEGHANTADEDYAGEFSLTHEDVGHFEIGFSQFSKFYDNRGGTYRYFDSDVAKTGLDREMRLKIGKLEVELGLLLGDLPDILLKYEYGYKDGIKSRLSWSEFESRGNGTNGVTRNITPTFQEINEDEHVFEVEVSHKLFNFDVKATGEWEFVRSSNMREEKDLSETSSPSDKVIRDQFQKPQSDMFVSMLEASHWFNKDSAYFGVAYRYTKINNKELEDLITMNENREVVNFGYSEQTRNSTAHNELDQHTVVANGMFRPWASNDWTVIAKATADTYLRDGYSTSPIYDDGHIGIADPGTAFDGVLDNTHVRTTENQVHKTGEGISLRYEGIDRAAIYAEGDFEQVRNWISEESYAQSGARAAYTSEIWFRETVLDMNRNSYAVGAQMYPWDQLNIKTQFSQKITDSDFDNFRLSNTIATDPQSAFIQSYGLDRKEVSTTITYKPLAWLRPSFRYQHRRDDTQTTVRGQEDYNTDARSNIFTFNLFWHVFRDLFLNGSYSKQIASTKTVATDVTGIPYLPVFNADVDSWLVTAEHSWSDNLLFTSSFDFSKADNFKDFADTGMPLGATFESLGVNVGVKWTPKTDWTVEPRYGFYSYSTGENDSDVGDYDAHVVWLKISAIWG